MSSSRSKPKPKTNKGADLGRVTVRVLRETRITVVGECPGDGCGMPFKVTLPREYQSGVDLDRWTVPLVCGECGQRIEGSKKVELHLAKF